MRVTLHKMDDDKEKYYLIMIFRGARTNWDQIVKYFTGEKVHVDVGVCMPGEEGFQDNFTVFSAYVGKPLQKTDIHQNYYDVMYDTAYAFEIESQEAHNVHSFLQSLYTKNTPYNSKDLVLCTLPSFITRNLPDVALHNVETVFCSQMGVLCVRIICTSDISHTQLLRQINSMNSRSTSPAALLQTMKPYIFQISLRDYMRGIITPVKV